MSTSSKIHNLSSSFQNNHWHFVYNSARLNLRGKLFTRRLPKNLGLKLLLSATIWAYQQQKVVYFFVVRPKHASLNTQYRRKTLSTKVILLSIVVWRRYNFTKIQLLHRKCNLVCYFSIFRLCVYKQHTRSNSKDFKVRYMPSFDKVEGKVEK